MPPPDPASANRAPAQALGALLQELETSLAGSQKAALTGDGPGLERGTGEQVRLLRSLEGWQGLSGLPAEVRAAAARVLQAARVQAALLRRARQRQRILSNLVAGRGSLYAAPPRPSAPF